MLKEWYWSLSHTLDSKNYYPYDNGQVSSATLRNTGEGRLHIYGFGIEFEWQGAIKHWWNSKCDIFLKPEEETELPLVGFSIPIDLQPKIYKYRVGVQTESLPLENQKLQTEWKNHGLVWGGKEHKIGVVRHPSRDYQVFISHSNHEEDKHITKTLATLLSNNGISYFIAEESPKYGEILWKKIKRGIISTDRAIILWTKYSAKSGDVREELGIIAGARKRFIPIIEKGVNPKGTIIGTEYISIDRQNYKGVFVNLTKELIKSSREKAKRVKKVKPEEGIVALGE